ncbi:hypothetical protein [Filifactor villosus]|uniref:CRISPR-associated protein n=1 Tax=Filifactor villosus TaxID=29374 RepID=A0ABV9QHQ7_9FIRM
MLINFSNHPSQYWSKEQREAASQWGEIEDLAFPAVPAHADETEVEDLACRQVERILEKNPTAVLCQGEFTLTYAVVKKLKEKGITVVSACSERNTKEVYVEGISKKEIVFEFVRFREYGEK